MHCACESLSTFSRNDPTLSATPGALSVLRTQNLRLDLHLCTWGY